ncbi:MAG: transketolase [Candidatus Methanomethylophilaceae archaeon]|nr:transketolase [Candidatus Methanomethylophilaceae archaeon]MDI3541149.1 transketolase [Candidatus Methanomethylophilaceae archaeon]
MPTEIHEVEMLREKARLIRKHVIEMTCAAGSGHPGGSLSAAEIIATLYFKVMRHDPKYPEWEERDRFVLSKGHVAPALYAALAEAGYFPVEELRTLRELGSRLQGHPARGKLPGIEMSTGSLGQGLSVSNGMALAAKLNGSEHRIYCLCGDGELQSGQNWEAAMLAAHYRLDNVTLFIDRNRLQIMGDTESVMSLEPLADKWRAFKWNVLEIDGHDIEQIINASETARRCKGKPTAIIANTIKGRGVSFMENNPDFHGKCCNAEEKERALHDLEECR